jgi:hypothetical protein
MGCLLPAAIVSATASNDAPRETAPAAQPVVFSRQLKPRDRPEAGDRWRVRVSHYPMQEPEPHWQPPETWLFVATEIQRTEDGPRLLVTATREGDARPSVFLEMDPETGTMTRVDSLLPVAGGARSFTERASPGEPFMSVMSPAPLSLAVPDSRREPPEAVDRTALDKSSPKEAAAAERAGGEALLETTEPAPDAGGQAGEKEPGVGGPAAATRAAGASFGFGPRFRQQTEPIDAGVGRAMIQRGLAPLRLPARSEMEAFGVPRFRTVIEGAGARVEQVWDESTPWPLYSQTETSRSWLVVYAKGKSS